MSDLAAVIDLSRHGVIEAHAGTGKTYTIVRLAMRILKEQRDGQPQTHIREIMLVTYTEKAAGELKARLRERLEEEIAGLKRADTADRSAADRSAARRLREHLEDCLNNLHEALIGTIHGVCSRLLHGYPFETGQRFSTELVDDTAGLAEALRVSIRTRWADDSPENPVRDIPWALERLLEFGGRIDGADLERIVAIAREALDDTAVIARQAVGGHTLATLRPIFDHDGEALRACREFKELAATVNETIDIMRRISNDPQGCFSQVMLDEFVRREEAWRNALETTRLEPKLFSKLNTYAGAKRFKTAAIQKHPLYIELIDLHERLGRSPLLRLLDGSTLKLTLIADAAQQLREDWIEEKRRRGLLSFHDMLRNMHRAVQECGAFRRVLRGRLKFAIIDEFQDTSMLQWRIFERLLLEEPDGETPEQAPRLYLVGDPKQSIYSFQGADVKSYLAARERITAGTEGRIYPLAFNFRSLPAMVDGCNAVFCSGTAENWFGDSLIRYDEKNRAATPARPLPAVPVTEESEMPIWLGEALARPLQVVPLSGSAGERRRTMAGSIVAGVNALHGRRIVLPAGEGWAPRLTLDYGHFAVIVESHALAEPVIEAFQLAGIPYAKYKQEGVFQSDMARQLRTLFAAIADGDPASRLAVLLTAFFNIPPSAIDPDAALEAQSPLAACLDRWIPLAERRAWPRLFRAILEMTGVQERLLRLADGDRQLADLRQVMEYVLDLLVRGGQTLSEVIEHLENLEQNRECAAGDQNLLVKASSRACVQILTMHAAKGLEFPVTFLMTGAGKQKSRGYLRWIDERQRLQVMPCDGMGAQARHLFPGIDGAEAEAALQRNRERRRLIYVAMTRAKALCFVPLHLGRRRAEGERWQEVPLPGHAAEEDLSPVLQRLLDMAESGDNVPAILSDHDSWESAAALSAAEPVDSLADIPADPDLDKRVEAAGKEVVEALEKLGLRRRMRIQTSYTELSRNAESDRGSDKADEEGDIDPFASTALPGGTMTGSALHDALEACIGMESLAWAGSGQIPADIERLVLDRLDDYRVLHRLNPEERERAAAAAIRMVDHVLSVPLDCCGFGEVAIGSLPLRDRRAEVEFHLGVEPHRVYGFMDLLFRLGERYFVLDWKSNRLSAYDADHVGASMADSHYDLQAKVYSHALHTFLRGHLGRRYDPGKHMGGAIYVYLRGYEHENSAFVWTRRAEPEIDGPYVEKIVKDLAG